MREQSARFLILSTLAFCFLLVSCENQDEAQFSRVLSDRATLIDSFESYESPRVVQDKLQQNGFSWTALEDGTKTPSRRDGRPPFQIYVIKTPKFTHLGHEGDLRLEFFNDRLMAISFYPKDIVGYRKSVEQRYPVLVGHQTAEVEKNTKVIFSTDYEKRPYATWEDPRLREQFYLWIKRYS